MPWIARDSALTLEEMQNNATIQTNYFRANGMADESIAAILGNEQAESTINPLRTESGGGGGFGLVQWTPRSSLENACSIIGISPYTDGDVQSEVIIRQTLGDPGSVNTWYTTSGFVTPYYPSGATPDMIGVTGSQFLTNANGWTAEKQTIMFMVGFERPSYDPTVNHIDQRIAYANYWYEFIGGVIPPVPGKKKRGRVWRYDIFA